MKRSQFTLVLLAVLFTGFAAHAQDKPAPEKSAADKPAADKHPPIPVTLTVVFSEFEGDRKVGSLPYSMPVNAAPRTASRGWSQLRMGVRVPIKLSSDPNVAQTVQYMDVGTNIDCRAFAEEGSFIVELQVERSSIYSVGAEGKRVEWSPDERVGIASQPIVRQYRSTMELLMRDGQTIQRSIATDPLSGRQLKVDVTLNVVK